jgi:hypothetical protein
MNTKEAYELMQNNCGIYTGDTVNILREARSYEMGWNTEWVSQMTDMIGKNYEVEEIKDDFGIRLEKYWFPFFVLEKIKEKEVFKLKIVDNDIIGKNTIKFAVYKVNRDGTETKVARPFVITIHRAGKLCRAASLNENVGLKTDKYSRIEVK